MKSNISFDQLQKEITDAEKYLHDDKSRWVTTKSTAGTTILRRSREGLEQLQEQQQSESTAHESLKPNASRYADPAEREKLLSRLIAQQQLKQKLTPEHAWESGGVSSIQHDSAASIRSEASSDQFPRDTLFYASDLLPQPHASMDFLSTVDEDSLAPNPLKATWKEALYYDQNPEDAAAAQKKKILKSKQELISESEKKFQEECPFQPKIFTSSKKANMQHIDHMITEHAQTLKLREHKKQELARAELAHCTFKPQLARGTETIITNKINDLKAAGVNCEDDEVAERLYNFAALKLKQQRELQKELDAVRSKDYPFKPTIKPYAADDSLEYKPIYDRVAELQKSQTIHRHMLRESYEEAERAELTFNPSINPHSKVILERRTSDEPSTDVATRLLEQGKKLMDKKHKLMSDREAALNKEMEPPKISRGSEVIVKINPKLSSSTFIDRQQEHNERVKDRIDTLRQQEEAASSRWFQPDIAEKSRQLMQERRPAETEEQRLERLSKHETATRAQKIKNKENEIYGNITFVPKIDEVSRVLGRKSSIDELVSNPRGQYVKEKAKQKVDEKQGQICSFKPDISASQKSYQKEFGKRQMHFPVVDWNCPIAELEMSKSYTSPPSACGRSVHINFREPEKMAREIRLLQQEKEEKRRAELIAQEMKELEECTFHPKVHSKPPVSSEPVVVRGIGRHLELQNMSIKQKEDLLRRQKEAFRVKNVEKYRREADGVTVVEPFHLSESTRTTSRAVQELLQQEDANMTFSPNTYDAQKRTAVRELVNTTRIQW